MKALSYETTLPAAGLKITAVVLCGVAVAWVLLRFSTPLVAVALLGVIFFIVFLRRPDIGLLVVLAVRSSTDVLLLMAKRSAGAESLAANQGGIAASLLSPNTGLILILILVGGLYILARRVRWISLPGGLLLTLLLVTGVVGMLRSESILLSFRDWLPVVGVFIVYALTAHFFRTPQQIQRVITVLAVSFILPALYGFHQLFGGTYRMFSLSGGAAVRIIGTFVHPNAFAVYLVLILAVFLCQSLTQSRWQKRVSLTIVVSAGVLLIATFARISWVGAIIVLLTVGVLRDRRLLLVVPFIVVLTAIASPITIARIGNPIEDRQTTGVDDRFEIWRTTFNAWKAGTAVDGSPISTAMNRLGGLGPGAVESLTKGTGYLEGQSYAAHDDYIRVINEYGVFGLVLYIVLILTMLALSYRTMRRSTGTPLASVPLAFFALTLAYVVMSITDNVFGATQNQIYYWTLAGLTAAISQRMHAPERQPGPAIEQHSWVPARG